jgi:hypothetical protein
MRTYPPLMLSRRFGLLDAMVLVVAFALTFVIVRDRYEAHRGPSPPAVHRTVAALAEATNSMLMALTLAFTVMAFRSPRRRLRFVIRRPGPAALLAASLAFVVMVARMAVKTYSMHSWGGRGEVFELRYIYPWIFGQYTRIGFAVIGSWLTLVLVRGWRPEPSWLDRARRALGWGWIALALSYLALPWIEPHLPVI